VTPRNLDAVKAAFQMPPGGNTTVAGERVSWVVGYVESRGRRTAFVARARDANLSMQAGADVALRTLNARPPQ